VNRTAPLHKQGDVTVYRNPQAPTMDKLLYFNPVPSLHTGFDTALIYDAPPNTVDEANLYPSSETWAAEEGCYVQFSPNRSDNPLLTPSCPPRFYRFSNDPFPSQNLLMESNIAVVDDALGNTETMGIRGVSVPFNTSGAYFTGLSEQTTLRITVVWLIERVPTFSERDLVVLAKPAVPYDLPAIQAAIDISALLPPGCRQSENPAGEWWKQVLGVLKLGVGTFLPAALSEPINGILTAGDSLASDKNVQKQVGGALRQLQQTRNELRKANKATADAQKQAKAAKKAAAAPRAKAQR